MSKPNTRASICCPKFPRVPPVGPVIPAFACDPTFVLQDSASDDFSAFLFPLPNANWNQVDFAAAGTVAASPEAGVPNAHSIAAAVAGNPQATYIDFIGGLVTPADLASANWQVCWRSRLVSPAGSDDDAALSGMFVGVIDPTQPPADFAPVLSGAYVGIMSGDQGVTPNFSLSWANGVIGATANDTGIPRDNAWHVWSIEHALGSSAIVVLMDGVAVPGSPFSFVADPNFPTGANPFVIPGEGSAGAIAGTGAGTPGAEIKVDDFTINV